jgi:hypothetical protein
MIQYTKSVGGMMRLSSAFTGSLFDGVANKTPPDANKLFRERYKAAAQP